MRDYAKIDTSDKMPVTEHIKQSLTFIAVVILLAVLYLLGTV